MQARYRDRKKQKYVGAIHDSCELSDELWQALSAEFSDEAALELLMLVGNYRRVSILSIALRLPLEVWAARFP